LNFTGLKGFPGNQKKNRKIKNRKFKTGVTKKGWLVQSSGFFLAGRCLRGVTVEAREK